MESHCDNPVVPLSPSKPSKYNADPSFSGILSSPPLPSLGLSSFPPSIQNKQHPNHKHANRGPFNSDTPPPSSPLQQSESSSPCSTRHGQSQSQANTNSNSNPFIVAQRTSSTQSHHVTPSLTALALGASPTKPSARFSHLNASRSLNRNNNIQPSSIDPKAGFKLLDKIQIQLEKDLVEKQIREKGARERSDKQSQPVTPVTHLLLGSYTHSLVLGRGKPNGSAHSSSAQKINGIGEATAMGVGARDRAATGTPTPDYLSGSPSPSASTGLGAKKSQHVLLPNTARHVSRAHAVVEFIPFVPNPSATPRDAPVAQEAGSFVVRILGQNGLIVNGKRRKEGSVIPLIPASASTSTSSATLLDFFGMCARFDVGPAPQSIQSSISTPTSKAPTIAPKPGSSLSERLGLSKNIQDGSSPIKSSNLTHRPRQSLLGSTPISRSSKPAASNSTPAALASSSPIPRASSSPSASRRTNDADGLNELSSPASSAEAHSNKGKEDQDETEDVNMVSISGSISREIASTSPSTGRGKSTSTRQTLGKRSRHEVSSKNNRRSDHSRHISTSSTRPLSNLLNQEHDGDVTMEMVPDSQIELSESEDDEDEEAEEEEGSHSKEGKLEGLNSNSIYESKSESSSDSSGEESDLTPSPSASPEPTTKKRQVKKARRQEFASTLSPSSSSSSSSSLDPAAAENLSESQMKMPPPAVPAKNRVKFSEHVSQVPANGSSASSTSPTSGSNSDSTLSNSLQTLARYCISTLSPTYDLEGLLAGSIVFHRTATISATEAVKSVLAGTPSMMRGEAGGVISSSSAASTLSLRHGDLVPGWRGLNLSRTPEEIRALFNGERKVEEEKWSSLIRRAWREKLENVLQSKEMFGVIVRKGRDASGNPLECWYYYDHSLDTDSTRASNLGAFAKPIRGALKTQKAVVWQRRTYSNSNEWDGATGSLPASASASIKSEKVIKFGDNSDSLIRNDASQSMDSNANGVRDRVPTKGYQNAVWMETQPIEEDESTWDRVGDMDYKEKVEKRRK